LEPPGAESLLLDWLPGNLAVGGSHWSLASELEARECFRQIDKVSGFHSLRVSGGDEISLFVPSSGLGIVLFLLE
jgi:hypothetical protein